MFKKWHSIFIILFLIAGFAGCSLFVKPATNVKVANMFSDNMVLQQQIKIPVWGEADPGGKVTIKLGDQKKTTIVPETGKWKVELSPLKAGGPLELSVIGAETLTFKNVLIGEVWVCSGQSNMQMSVSQVNQAESEIAAANFPNIRLLTVARTTSVRPQEQLDCNQWQECSPATIGNFSAVGFFYGRYLHEKLNVPIGLINTSWGGTIVEAWTSSNTLKDIPPFSQIIQQMAQDSSTNEAELMAEYQKKQAIYEVAYNQKLAELKDSHSAYKEKNLDTRNWKKMELPTFWETTELGQYDGVVWFRKTIDIPATWAGKPLKLHLGPINDLDMTWFNGEKVGETDGHQKPRIYNIPAALVKTGPNEIAVQVLDLGNNGGIWGVPEQLQLVNEAGASIALAGFWKYFTDAALTALPERPISPVTPNRPTVLFNTMISPLIPFAIRGAIWYQGESNAGRAHQYRTLFPALINDWRQHWNQGEFPFLFVQLANFLARMPHPAEDTWAELREAQLMTLALPNTGMAVIIDIGEAEDIHPKNKQDVGKRLALNALNSVYGQKIVFSGPIYKSMTLENDKIRLAFDHVNGGLMTPENAKLTGFAIAGEDKKFYWADAEIDGETIVVSGAQVTKPVAVRYAWAANPDCNLYNTDGLPASPFRTDSWPGITVGIE
jgi:sialate O-acetylesterase